MFPISLLLNDVTSLERSSFHRPFYENVGYSRIAKDGKLFFVINALGVDEKDLTVKVESAQINNWQNIVIQGETRNELLDEPFSVRQKHLVRSLIKSIGWTLKNGILTLEVELESPVQPNVKIYNK